MSPCAPDQSLFERIALRPAVRCEFFVHYIVSSYCSCELGQAAAQPWLGLLVSYRPLARDGRNFYDRRRETPPAAET